MNITYAVVQARICIVTQTFWYVVFTEAAQPQHTIRINVKSVCESSCEVDVDVVFIHKCMRVGMFMQSFATRTKLIYIRDIRPLKEYRPKASFTEEVLSSVHHI